MSKRPIRTIQDTRKFFLVGGIWSSAIGLLLIIVQLGYFFLTFFSVIEERFDPISWKFLCGFPGWLLLSAGLVLLICGLAIKRSSNPKNEMPPD